MRTGAAPVWGRIAAVAVICGVAAVVGATSMRVGGPERVQLAVGPSSTRDTLSTGIDPAAIRIVDGDTIAVGVERIRLMGFDAPETHRSRCLKERELGERAKARLGDLLRSGQIGVRRHRLDRYGRTLAVVSVNGRDVAETMIAEGMARPYRGRRRQSWCSGRL